SVRDVLHVMPTAGVCNSVNHSSIKKARLSVQASLSPPRRLPSAISSVPKSDRAPESRSVPESDCGEGAAGLFDRVLGALHQDVLQFHAAMRRRPRPWPVL